jgi:hypothetical protein
MLWTFAATDWGMSLEPAWSSSMYPVGWMVWPSPDQLRHLDYRVVVVYPQRLPRLRHPG